MTHELDTNPIAFQATLDGQKPFEVRYADRPFAVGDILRLREWDPTNEAKYPSGYSGRELDVMLTHVAHGKSCGLPEHLCVLSVAKIAA